jgi:anti-sigma regulatory factor (Ser/Thr protein kinase)
VADRIRSREVDLPRTELAPRVARQALQKLLSSHPQLEPLTDDACALVSELVTNAVLHARGHARGHDGDGGGDGDGSVRLNIRLDHDGTIYIAVSDTSPLPPVVREPTSDAEGGRGLQIVEQLSARWGFELNESGGKTVWVEIR